MQIRLDLRGTDRVLALIWELRQLEYRLRVAGHPEADALERMLDRFLTDIGADEPEEPPTSF